MKSVSILPHDTLQKDRPALRAHRWLHQTKPFDLQKFVCINMRDVTSDEPMTLLFLDQL